MPSNMKNRRVIWFMILALLVLGTKYIISIDLDWPPEGPRTHCGYPF